MLPQQIATAAQSAPQPARDAVIERNSQADIEGKRYAEGEAGRFAAPTVMRGEICHNSHVA